MIESSSITDPLFRMRTPVEQTTYYDAGALKFEGLCLEYNIDSEQIAMPIPFHPARIQTVCVLICIAQDLIGSEWRQVRDGLTIDVYQAKLNSLNGELQSLLTNFTPTTCGYTVEGQEPDTTADIRWERA